MKTGAICKIVILSSVGISASCQNGAKYQHHIPSVSEQYIDRQSKIIDAHAKQLVKAGRITDSDHFHAELYLATYGWHSACGNSAGTDPVFCNGGSFGAYSFSEVAFKQAQRLYVIHGEMLAGTDILIDASWGECIEEKGGGCIIGSSDGYTSPRKPGAFDPAVVGFTVGSLTYCMKYGAHYEHCEGGLGDSKDYTEPAKVIKFIDGGHIQLDHKAKYDAEMYGLVIMPPDYVDMCECTVPVMTPSEPTPKSCVQGGTLAPGESCSVGIEIK